MADLSYRDKKYFVSPKTYNCPFCNRRSVGFAVPNTTSFQWSEDRTVFLYIVRCDDCGNRSAHFSDFNFDVRFGSHGFSDPDDSDIDELDKENIDKYFFHHQPSSFFTIDSRIPKVIRELLEESDGSRRMNFLVGSSGALRKAIYEFLKNQEVDKTLSYEDQIKSLKSKHTNVDSGLFDILASIQGMTSEELHENTGEWAAWTSSDLAFLSEMFTELLREVYIAPLERKEKLSRIEQLRSRSSFKK